MANGTDREFGRFQGSTEASLKALARSIDDLREEQQKLSKAVHKAVTDIRYIKGQSSILGALAGLGAGLITYLFKE
tara:strand:- start:221 stop:448 length:228 start_codon:yes stop_codon:yes gene_type:complete